MGCGSSVANRNPNTTEKQQTANDETTSVRPLTRSSTLTTVSSTRGRKASSSTGMPYLVDYGKLARSVDEELDELQSSFKEKSPPSNALTKPGSFKYGDLELTQQELSRQRIERFARNSPSSDRSGPLLNSRQRSVFALNDFSILEDDLLGAPSYADWSPEVLVVRPEIVLSLPVNMSGYSKRIRTIAMLNSGGFYVATADSDACYAHNAKGEVSRRYPDFKNAKKGLVDRVMSITIPRDGEKFATLHADGAVVLREVSQVEVGESRDVTLIPEDSNGPPSAIAITLESEMVLVGDTAGHIRAFDVLNKRQTSFQKHGTTTKRSAVHFLEMSHFYNRNITRGAETSMLDANDAFLGVAAATTTTTTSTTRNGKERTVEVKVIRPYLVMSGGGDNVVHLWLTSVPEANYCTYFKHDCPVKNGFFLPNGRTAVTSDDKAVHLWAYTVLDVINGKPPVVPANALDTTTPLRKVTLIEMVKSLSLSTTGNEGKIVIPPPQKNGTIHSTSSDFATSAGHHPLAGPNTCWSARKALFGPTGTSQIHVFTTSTVYRPNKGNCGFFIADTHGGLFAFTIYSNDQWTVWSTNRSAPICALATSPGLLIIGDVFGNLQRYNIRNSPQQDCDY